MAKSKLKRMTLFDYINYFFFFCASCVFLYPVLNTLMYSISDPVLTATTRVYLWPAGFTLDAYGYLLSDGRILRYYGNTIFYALGGTVCVLFFTSLMAFPFCIDDFRGKGFFNLYMVVTMFFGGGMIPTYYIMRSLGMIDNPLVMIIPGCVGAWNLVIFRTFFRGIPAELRESAYMDGAGHYTVLFRIIIPTAKPLLATIALFTMVGKWNDYFTALLYFRNQDLSPIQTLLRKLLILVDFKDVESMASIMLFQNIDSRSVKCAAVMITIAPILCVYPFLQKYFAKGILVGALKA